MRDHKKVAWGVSVEDLKHGVDFAPGVAIYLRLTDLTIENGAVVLIFSDPMQWIGLAAVMFQRPGRL
jgi:hypothetical protein